MISVILNLPNIIKLPMRIVIEDPKNPSITVDEMSQAYEEEGVLG